MLKWLLHMRGLLDLQIRHIMDTLKFPLSHHAECWSAHSYYGYIDTWIASGQVTGFLLLSDSLEACLDYSAGQLYLPSLSRSISELALIWELLDWAYSLWGLLDISVNSLGISVTPQCFASTFTMRVCLHLQILGVVLFSTWLLLSLLKCDW